MRSILSVYTGVGAIYLLLATDFAYAKQPPYAFVHEYGRLVDYNPEYCNVTVHFFKFNRTSGVMNVTWVVLKDQTNVTLHVEGYQFLSNEFRKSVIDMDLPLCDFLSGERTDFDAINIFHKCGDIKTCPLHKGDIVYLCNIAPHPSQFPPFIPRGRWSIRLTLVNGNGVALATIEWILQILDINQI